jgi:hypothetical protein
VLVPDSVNEEAFGPPSLLVAEDLRPPNDLFIEEEVEEEGEDSI